jgi:hypothetical protein
LKAFLLLKKQIIFIKGGGDMARIIQARGCKIGQAIVLFLLITTGFLSTAVAGYVEVELPRDSIEGERCILGFFSSLITIMFLQLIIKTEVISRLESEIGLP